MTHVLLVRDGDIAFLFLFLPNDTFCLDDWLDLEFGSECPGVVGSHSCLRIGMSHFSCATLWELKLIDANLLWLEFKGRGGNNVPEINELKSI